MFVLAAQTPKAAFLIESFHSILWSDPVDVQREREGILQNKQTAYDGNSANEGVKITQGTRSRQRLCFGRPHCVDFWTNQNISDQLHNLQDDNIGGRFN